MAESISVNFKSVVNTGGASVASASGGSEIEVLKKKLVSLQKDLKDAIGMQSKEGMAKAKLIQLQIQVTQARMEQLIQQQAQRAMEANKSEKPDASLSIQINSAKKEVNPVLGRNIDEFV